MKIKDFSCEQWMTRYERQALYNMTDTSFESLRLGELIQPEDLDLDLPLNYGEIFGSERLKQEIETLYTTNDKAIATCHGALQANEQVMTTLLEPGDHVIAFKPGYQQFYDLPLSLGCTVSVLAYEEEEGWRLPLKAIEHTINDRTKMIVLASPSNPTGTQVSLKEWESLIAMCAKRKIYLVCDEVYRGLDLESEPSISDLYEYGIACGSLSKIYALPGLRIGWIRASQEVIDRINVRRDYTFISTGPLVDHLGWLALTKKDEILKRNRQILKANQKTLDAWLAAQPRFSVQYSKNSPVAFLKYDLDLDSKTLCRRLLAERQIFFVPGACFGYEGYLRLGLGRDPAAFQAGLDQFSQWVDEALKTI